MPSSPSAAAPDAATNTKAEAERQAAQTSALTESAQSGRRSTIVAGMKIAEDEQAERGMLSQKKRAAGRAIAG